MENWYYVYLMAVERSEDALRRANAIRALSQSGSVGRRSPRRSRGTGSVRRRRCMTLHRGLGRFMVVLRARRIELSLSIVRVYAGRLGEGHRQSRPG